MGDFNLQTTLRSGPLSLDVDPKNEKRQRLKLTSGAAICLGEPAGAEGTGALRPAAFADPANALFWQHDPAKGAPRGAWGSWSFAIPAALHSGGRMIRPYASAGVVDEDFLPLYESEYVGPNAITVMRKGYGADKSRFAGGTEFIVTSTTGHGTHEKLAAPVGGPLVACHWDLPEYSRHVFEVRSGALAEHGPLHSHLRVVDCPVYDGHDDHDGHIPAWNLGVPGPRDFGAAGRGAFVAQSYTSPPANLQPADFAFPVVGINNGLDKSVGAFASVLADGPLHTGSRNDKHRRGVAKDGTPWNAGHLSTGALWYCDDLRDGPQEFTRKIYPLNARDGGFFQTPVEQQFDPNFYYTTPTGVPHTGAWRWVARSPIYTPDAPPVLERAIQRIEQKININVNVNLNINWGFWWIPIPVPINPGNGDPVDIARIPLETGFPSIHGTAIRRADQPYDGRFGAPSSPTGIRGVDPANLPPGFSTGGRDQIEGSDQTNYSGSGEGSVDRLFGGPELDETGSADPVQPTGYSIGQEVDALRKEPLLSNPAERPWALSSPVVWSIHSIGAVNSSGEADSTFAAGDFFKHAPTTDGALWFTPPEIVPDAEAAPRTTSITTFALYNGLWPSTSAACGTAAQLGFGTPSQETGAISDGYYDTVTGATGSINAERRFVDASGAARTGTTSHYGTFRVTDGSAGAPSLSFHDDTDTGIYRGGANQLNFATNGTLRARINTAALAPAGSGTTLGALSDPWAEIYGTEIYVGGHRVPRTLSSQYADATNSGTGEDDLLSYTVPANTLSANGDSIVFEAPFSLDGTPDTLTIKFKFGATSITIFGASVDEETVVARIRVVRVTQTTQRIYVVVNDSLLTTTPNDQAIYTTASEDLSGAVVTKFTGEAATSGDTITQRAMYVRLDPT